MLPSPSVKEFGIFVFWFRFWGNNLRMEKIEEGENVPKAETVYPKLSPWLRTRGTVLSTAVEIQRTKG